MNKKKIEKGIRLVLEGIGEDADRPGLKLTPTRVAEMYDEIFSGLKMPTEEILKQIEGESHDEMVFLKDIPFYSVCVGRKMCVYTKKGTKFAEDIMEKDEILTFDEEKNLVYTTVGKVFSRKVNEIFEIEIDEGIKIKVTQEHPLYVKNKGWMQAKDLTLKDEILIVKNRKGIKRRRNLTIKKNYNLGYFIGGLASDGSIWRNQVRLEVNEKSFAKKFASSIEKSFGLQTKIEKIQKPSGFLKEMIEQYRVRVVCGELVRIVKDIFGGGKKAKSFHLPQIVLENENIFKGFLHGYLDGDGTIYRGKDGKLKYARIFSNNKVFLEELAEIFHSKIGRSSGHGEYELHVPARWLFELKRKGFYRPFVPVKEDFIFKNYEFKRIKDKKIKRSKKKYIVYNFSCYPFNTFIINGVWVHNCEHHLLPFIGRAHVAYIPAGGRIVGLSELAKALEILAKRPQVQERLTTQLADMIMEKLKPKGAMVIIDAEHLCLSMRGIKKPGARTVTSAVRGIFRSKESTRSELLALIKKKD